MPRVARLAPGGMVFHVLNGGVGRMTLFEKDDVKTDPKTGQVQFFDGGCLLA